MPATLPLLFTGLVVGALSVGADTLRNKFLRDKRSDPTVPKPSDGKYNLKQSVPTLTAVLGRVKKSSDYILLEERAGIAYHVLSPASHRVQGYVQHYLHDEAVTLDGNGVVIAPEHFHTSIQYIIAVFFGATQQVSVDFVRIETRVGMDTETAYSRLISALPGVWTSDHRGDGLASVLMEVRTAPAETFDSTFPQHMPQHSAIIDGALLYDPRTETTAFSKNIALFRLFHLTHASGFKRTLDDLYMPEWIAAANVCDEDVTNRDGQTEKRYHGGFWYRYDNDPVEVGRLIDEAAELVVYERADGKIGVHAGSTIDPDIRLTEADINRVGLDVNRRSANSVLAVRGRFTDPSSGYNTVDAAIYGNPYTGDDNTQRTKTVDNQIVQSHNHCQRLQKIAFIRANAPRVKFTADYEAAKAALYRRFVRVHYPPLLDEAVIEIVDRPRLSLGQLLIEFDGIVVPEDLYSFVAATEEGERGGVVDILAPEGVPVPVNFQVAISSETITSGGLASFAVAGWDLVDIALLYELEFQPSDESVAPQSVVSKVGVGGVRTPYLPDGEQYRFRLRAWSGGAYSSWTDYVILSVVADTSPPGQPTSFASSKTGSSVTLSWINPNSANFFRSTVYRGATSSFAAAVPITTLYGGINSARSYTDVALPNGTYYWWVKAFNASDVGSAEVGPETQTVG